MIKFNEIFSKYYVETIILLFAFLVRVIGVNYGLPYSYHTEEYKVVNYALKFGTGDLNPHFFEYPSLYLYFMFFVYGVLFIVGRIFGLYGSTSEFAMLYFRDPTIFYFIGRIISTVFGTLCVWMVYIISKKLFDRKVALISMLLFSVIPSIIVSCKIVRIEMALIFVSLLFFWFLLKTFYDEEDKNFNYYICAILIGIGTSLKYLPLIFTPLIFYVNFLKTRKLFNRRMIICCFLLILFFVLGTPYSVLDYKSFITDIMALTKNTYGEKVSYIKNFFITSSHYLFIGNEKTSFFPFLGIIGFYAFFNILYRVIKDREYINFVLLYPILANALVVIRHYFPGKGFLFISFPYFVILVSYGLNKIFSKNKIIFYIIFILCFIPSFTESIIYNIYFSLKDTRTIALEWIEKNIPYGSKILIDRYPNSPPIKMDKTQLEKLYKKAVELNHYKKEYFYWQLRAHLGENYGYEIYEIQRSLYEIGTVKHQVEEAQKVRDVLDITKGVEFIKNFGIKYVILNSYSATESTKKFYEEVEQKAMLMKEFKPKTKFHPGPEIRIYEL